MELTVLEPCRFQHRVVDDYVTCSRPGMSGVDTPFDVKYCTPCGVRNKEYIHPDGDGTKKVMTGKPRLSFDQLADIGKRATKCRQLKAAGLPCTEFSGHTG